MTNFFNNILTVAQSIVILAQNSIADFSKEY